MKDRIEALERVRAGDLKDHPANWRRHPKHQRAALAALLEEIGYADALIARREGDELVLIDGHLRKSLDPEQLVPVLVLDVSAEEAETILATLDPLAALARPDPEALSALLDRVRASSDAVADLLEGLARSAGLPLRGLLGDPDEICDAPPARSAPGDLWELGPHRLLCGDATLKNDIDAAMAGEIADAVLTDPPYGVNYTGKTAKALTISGDTTEGLRQLLGAAFSTVDSVLKQGAPIYVFSPAGTTHALFLEAFLAQGWKLHQGLVWVKDSPVLGHGDYHYQHEPIIYGYSPGSRARGRGRGGWYGGNDQSSVIAVPRPKRSADHPTTKPVELLRRLIANSTRRGQIVFDPFAGSGSTLIACELLERRCVSIEISPAYCDVALHRFEALTGGRATRLAGPKSASSTNDAQRSHGRRST